MDQLARDKVPYSYQQCVISFTTDLYFARVVVCHSYPTRLINLTVCRCHYKGRTFSLVKCWSVRGLKPRTPAQQTGALPTELTSRWSHQNADSFETTVISQRRNFFLTCSNFKLLVSALNLPFPWLWLVFRFLFPKQLFEPHATSYIHSQIAQKTIL